ncbi:hypothetical protein K435DRAFT_100022 [Dendrothele bispora CBS 962.96]|uniref:Uncharacterized protein n=1 Tax=Dendrothele bispora (strain CBS 962.96) TaxID=1314807 RepID=A0A4S8M2W7_DENBC|nr:hypothetical protein K435DRAFT_100022 [Dendrothele bispora CBS 962.96]
MLSFLSSLIFPFGLWYYPAPDCESRFFVCSKPNPSLHFLLMLPFVKLLLPIHIDSSNFLLTQLMGFLHTCTVFFLPISTHVAIHTSLLVRTQTNFFLYIQNFFNDLITTFSYTFFVRFSLNTQMTIVNINIISFPQANEWSEIFLLFSS